MTIRSGKSARARRARDLSPAEKSVVRREVYERDGGRCQLRLGPKCNPNVLPYDGDILFRAHLCHIVSMARGGKFEPANLRIGCCQCHIGYEHTQGRKSASD